MQRSLRFEWNEMGENSRRVDVPLAMLDEVPKPGINYVQKSEEHLPSCEQAAATGEGIHYQWPDRGL